MVLPNWETFIVYLVGRFGIVNDYDDDVNDVGDDDNDDEDRCG